MDFFQGSLPPNFISFCLGNQNVDEPQDQTNTRIDNTTRSSQSSVPVPVSNITPASVISPPPFPPTRISLNLAQQMAPNSPLNTDSNVDVTVYANEVVQRMEEAQELTEMESPNHVWNEAATAQGQDAQETYQLPELVQASTRIPLDQSAAGRVSLSQLESTLTVALRSQADLPELQLTTDMSQEMSGVSFLQSEGEATSSVNEPPPLHGGEVQPNVSGDYSDATQTGESVSQTDCPLLYATIPFCPRSGSEGGDESGSEVHDPGQPGTSGSAPQLHEKTMRALSGRSRATLKQYFETEDPYTFPVGQRVVAFTEPQVYYLLRDLTDEAINMTCFTMEKRKIGAVRGSPATAPSRTGKFQIRTRAPTPGPHDTAGSTSEGPRTEYGSGSETYGYISMLQDVSDVPNPDESENPTEMSLIDQNFKKTAPEDTSFARQWGLPQDSSGDGAEAVERNSLDVTLSEIRDQSSGRKSRQRGSTVKSAKTKRVQRRGVPMREEFFSKLGWTWSFISGPADPLHSPHMVWCHMCTKNFSIKTEGTVEILPHHRTEKHLRRDQKWRYEHLKSVDPVTGKVQHRVRGRNGKILSKIELAQELPKFIHPELFDVGERFPFYDYYIKRSASALATPQSRMETRFAS